MTDDSSDLICKFTGEIEQQSGQYVVQIPDTEIEYGTLSEGDVIRVSVERPSDPDDERGTARAGTETETQARDQDRSADQQSTPPVAEGERLTVDVEDRGDQGDGIARVDRGYVLIVPETEPGDTVEVRVTQTFPNYGFAERVETEPSTDQEVPA
ncbi:TRAM domain-containing protein [Halobiforma nitratireducens]|uniref:TRAM domain-containing protein n=1 Tax=Halobiforma nitratireducens JCM 10879 TaxID=1227454 RepID=M0LNY0_9EURY|nr:TRAM domain-containing protein [Halobiforma nitratireducens]EMA35252.1 TRAM domain-containing protein [Halobiforma nitratireducens JCM 10879]